MGPVARARLGRAEAVVPRAIGTSRIFDDSEAGVKVRVVVEVFEEGFAFSAVRMMVMMMMIRTCHHGSRMVECNVLAREWFYRVRCVRARACVRVPVIGRSGAERSAMPKGTAMRKGTVTRKGTAMRTGRSASSSQSCATVMATSAAMTAAPAAAAMTSATTMAATATMTTAGRS